MTWIKRVPLLLLVVLSLIGCQETQEPEQAADTPLVVTMFSEDDNQSEFQFNNPVARAITEETGVVLDINYASSAIEDRLDMMVASGNYPDLLMVKDMARFVEAGAYLDLKPLIDSYAPNIKALYEDKYQRMEYSQEDDSIYVLPAADIDEVQLQPQMGFALQHDVVSKLGYPKLETVDDFEQALKDYMAMYPEINGQPTIGMMLLVDDWRWLISLGNAAGFATGAPDDGQWYIDPDTYQATFRFLRQEEKEFYRWLNHMYNEGLIDPDSFVQKFESYQAKIASGRVLSLIDAQWQYDFAERMLHSKGMEERTYGLYPVQLTKETKAADFRSIGYEAGYGVGISTTCENPIEVIQFLDYLASHDGQVLRIWGIEGVNYTVDEAGRRQVSEEELTRRFNDVDYSRETGVATYIYPFPTYGVGVKDAKGNYYRARNPEMIKASYSHIEKKVLANYGAEMWADLYPSAEELTPSDWGAGWQISIPESSMITETFQTCNAIAKKGIINAVVVPEADFDAQWETMIQELDQAGVYEMNEAFTDLVKERVASWSD